MRALIVTRSWYIHLMSVEIRSPVSSPMFGKQSMIAKRRSQNWLEHRYNLITLYTGIIYTNHSETIIIAASAMKSIFVSVRYQKLLASKYFFPKKYMITKSSNLIQSKIIVASNRKLFS